MDGSDDGVGNTFTADQSGGTGHEIIKYAYNTGASTSFTMSVNTGSGLHQYAFVNVASETIPPVISTLNPADDAIGVAVTSNLEATFSENIAIGTGDITVRNLTDGTQTTIAVTDTTQVSISGAVLTVNPTADLAAGKNYAVQIAATAVKDLANNPFAGISNDTTWNFTTNAAGVWSTINWVDDSALSFITSTNVTHSGDFVAPTQSAATINGYTFETINIAGGFGFFGTPYPGSNFTIGGPLKATFDASAGVSGTASTALSTALIYSGGNATFNLTGLLTNTNYEFYFFSPDYSGTRTGSMDGSDDGVGNTTTIVQTGGTGDKIIKYAYNTGASTSFTMTVDNSSGLHNYAFVNVVPEPSASSYSTWASANEIPGQPAGGDFDKDGLSNIVEYALGLSPTVSSVPPGTFDGSLLSFTKGTEAKANGDVTYEIEQSTTLGGWTVVVPDAPASATISYTLPSGQPKVFARLKITQIP
jgi:hypothetical protein